MEEIKNTELSYLLDSYKFNDNSILLAIEDNSLILDHTIMYPQGGGQPYDLGRIDQGENMFQVNEVRFRDGIVYHIGEFKNGNFEIEKEVKVSIDEERRRLHARLHTAGHLVDDAIYELGYLLTPLKGYHFPDGPYVEYVGQLDGDFAEIAKNIENKMNELIRSEYQVESQFVPNKDDLHSLCHFVPEYIPGGKPIRVVQVSKVGAQCCGGTHVKVSSEVGQVSIPKIKVKDGNTRVSYRVN